MRVTSSFRYGGGFAMRINRTQLASLLLYLDAFIWLIGVVPTLFYASMRQELPSLGGIRLLAGPFEALGIDALIVAGMLYIIISALKVLAGYWLWNEKRDGAVLGFILLGLSAMFWYGFALPLGPLLGIAEIVILLSVWGKLKP